MLPEYRDLISELKQSDNHFARLFNEHNDLDEEIQRLENDPVSAVRKDEIEQKKRQKLRLKDQIYQLLKKEDARRKENG